MPQKLVDMWGTTTKGYPYEVMHKEEQPDVQTTLQTLRNSYTYLKIPKDHAHTCGYRAFVNCHCFPRID